MSLHTLAADAVLRFRGGRMLLHTASSPLPAWQCEQPNLIGWICQFARPTNIDAALARLGAADRAAVQPVLDYLRRSGVLVEFVPEPADADRAEQADALSRRHLPALSRSIYDLASDVLAFGPWAEQRLSETTGSGIESRLRALLAAVDGLRQELRSLREPFLAQQAQRLGLQGHERGLKLHLGCGPAHLPGWINIDVHPAPFALNVHWGLPFDDGSADFVFVSHMLEHLFFPHDVLALLRELHRVLRPGGRLRIVVPDIERCIEAYTQNDRQFFDSRRETWTGWPENATRLADFLAYAGAGPDPGYLFEAHKYGYDAETLSRVLAEAGFNAPQVSQFMGSEWPELRVDEVSPVAAARYGDRHYSLFMEAQR